MTIKGTLFIAVAVAVVGSALAGDTPITHCAFVVTDPGTYFVGNDLGPWPPPCAITVAASRVRLRLEGHTIAGLGLEQGDGILATAVHDIKIKGPGTITGFDTGIRWQNIEDSEVKGVTASRHVNGFVIDGGSRNRFKQNVVSNNLRGIAIEGSNDTTLEENATNDNFGDSGIAIRAAHGNALRGNTANHNGCVGFGGFGIEIGNSARNRIEENTANGNCSVGVALQFGSTENEIEDNTALGNQRFDLSDDGPNCDANR